MSCHPSSGGQRNLWSDLVDAQAGLSLHWAQKLFCWFCHSVAHFVFIRLTDDGRFFWNSYIHNIVWATSWQNQQNGMCTQRRLRSLFHPGWSESLLSAWRKLGSLATCWMHSKDYDQTGRIPRLIEVITWCTIILLVLSWGGSYLSDAYILLVHLFH